MGRSNRIPYLDGIRAVAILSVVAVHWVSPYVPLGLGGYVGVDVFFALSGYIITSILWKPSQGTSLMRDWWDFIVARTKRLYPALLGLTVAVPVLCFLLPTQVGFEESIGMALVAVSQVSSIWRASDAGGLGPFDQTWSLAVEWYFYLAWPVLVLLAKRRGASARTFGKVTIVAALIIYAGSLFQGDHWFYFGPLARFAELLAGGALALWLKSSPRTPVLPAWMPLGAVLVVGTYTVLGPVEWSPVARFIGIPLAVTFTLILIVAGRQGGGIIIRMLSSRPVALIGRASYSFYLWHLVPLALMGGHFLGLPKVVLGVIGVAFAITATIASYLFLERPLMKSRSSALLPQNDLRPASMLASP